MDLEAVLKDLREKYINDLPDVIEKIEALQVRSNLSLIREEFHKLRGTGKTYGIDEISQIGEVVENLCVFYPESATQLMPFAISVLKKIYAARNQQQKFSLEDDKDFSKLQQMAQKH